MMTPAPPFMWTLVAGTAAAALFAVPFAAGVGTIAPLTLTGVPLLAAGLGIGALAAAGAGVAGTAIVAALLLLLAAGLEPIVVFVALFAVPVVFVVHMLGRNRTSVLGFVEWYQPGTVAAWLAGAAVATICLIGSMIAAGQSDIETVTRAFIQPTLTAMMPEFGFHRIRSVTDALTPWLPGLVGTVWLLALALSTALAFAILHLNGALTRPLPRMAALRMPAWVPAGFAIAVAIAVLAGGDYAYLGRNAALILAVPMFLVGAGTFHAIADRTPIRALVLAVFYGFLLVFPPLAAVVAAIGTADQFLDLRRRTHLADSGQEV